MTRPPARAARCIGLLGMVLLAPCPAWAAINCTLTSNDTRLVYSNVSLPRAFGSLLVRCTRLPGDPTSISYRITADAGLHGSNATTASPSRAIRLAGGSSTLAYTLRRNLANCTGASDWGSPPSGSAGVMEGTVTFGPSSTIAGASLPYCIDVPVSRSVVPPNGYYTDTLQFTARYPSHAAGATTSVAVTVALNVNASCVITELPALTLNYPSFSPTPVVAETTARMQCNQALPWTASVNPANGTSNGLDYTLSVTPTAGQGTGTSQSLTIRGTIPAGRSGVCGTAVCSARRAHTLTITY